MSPRTAPIDPPHNQTALMGHVSRLGMVLWQKNTDAKVGVIFCPVCGYGGDIRTNLPRWTADPLGCCRRSETSCNGRPNR